MRISSAPLIHREERALRKSNHGTTKYQIPKIDEFLLIPRSQIADLVQKQGQRTVMLCVGGTRRWYTLHSQNTGEFNWESYSQMTSQRYLELFGMLFETGIHTILTPALYPPNFRRRSEYLKKALGPHGAARIVRSPQFLSFYRDMDVRVGLYGNAVSSPDYPHLAELDRGIRGATQTHQSHVLLWGLNCADDLLADVIRLAVAHYRESGSIPTRQELIELYYGWPMGAIDIFLAFGRLSITNLMPPLLDGREDLYFTVGLTLDLTEMQWREILHDHLYLRPKKAHRWNELSPHAVDWLRRFYAANQGRTLGLGRIGTGNIWYPRQVEVVSCDDG